MPGCRMCALPVCVTSPASACAHALCTLRASRVAESEEGQEGSKAGATSGQYCFEWVSHAAQGTTLQDRGAPTSQGLLLYNGSFWLPVPHIDWDNPAVFLKLCPEASGTSAILPDHWLQEWGDVDDGTMEGSLGYGNILESPPAAYIQLQARLLARRLQSATD